MAVKRPKGREQQPLWKSQRRLFKHGKKEAEGEWRNASLCDICPLNGISSAEQNSKGWIRVKRDRQKNTIEKAEGMRSTGTGKEWQEGQSTSQQSLRRREKKNLSYACTSHIAFTIYVPARIMQLDGSVEQTPINLILFSFFPPAFLSPTAPLRSFQSAFFGTHQLWSICRLLM